MSSNKKITIKEDMMPRTAPIKTDALLKIIQYTISNNSISMDFNSVHPDDFFMDSLEDNFKLVGIKNSFENMDYIFAFVKENAELINDYDFSSSDYVIPQKKKYECLGREVYTARKGDSYSRTEEMYSKEFLENALKEGEIEIWGGKLLNEEIYDTWDTEVEVDSIEEVPLNKDTVKEEVNLDTYESPFITMSKNSMNEDKMPRTAPVNTEGLLKVIQYTLQNHKDVSFDNLSPQNPFLDDVFTNMKLVGVKNVSENDIDDYVFTFMKDNASLLDSGNFNSEEYMIPQKKKFEWEGKEKYTAWKADFYYGTAEGYSEDYIRHLFDDYELLVSDGTYVDEEVYDVENSQQLIDSIKEVPFNESVNEQDEPKVDLDTFEAPFTSEDFMNYVESEWDIEMLNLLMGIISKRKKFLEDVLAKAEPRTVVKGFKRFDESKSSEIIDSLRILQEILDKK